MNQISFEVILKYIVFHYKQITTHFIVLELHNGDKNPLQFKNKMCGLSFIMASLKLQQYYSMFHQDWQQRLQSW